MICALLGHGTFLAEPRRRILSRIVWLPSIALAWILINTLMGLYPGVCLGLVDEIRRLSLSITVVALINVARLRVGADWFADRLLYLAVAYALCLFLAPVVTQRHAKVAFQNLLVGIFRTYMRQ